MNETINSEILYRLTEYVNNNPETGFTTALYNLGIIPVISNITDLYYETSDLTLKRMNKVKEKGCI